MESEYVHVGRAGGKLPPGIMRAILVDSQPDGTLNWTSRPKCWCSPTTIGENHYLNVVSPEDERRASPSWRRGDGNPSSSSPIA